MLRLVLSRVFAHEWLGMATEIQRFEREIGGRVYVIETSPIQTDRWRAQIARRPGLPSSLMPFYGPTPHEAAARLIRWLSLAHHVPVDPST
jgi:hypothetical protein